MRTSIVLAVVALTLSSCNLARMQHRLTEGRLKRVGYDTRTFQAPDGAHHAWYRDTGKPKLLLLHGYTGTGQLQWSKTAQLLRKDYDVIMPDLLCHGKSTTKWSGFNFDAQVAHVALLLDSLGVKGPIPVVGNSYGGGVAAHLAEVRPERVSKLVLYDALVSDYTKALADSLARSVGGESMLAVMRTPKVEDVRFGLRLSLYRQWPIPKFVLRQAYDLNIKPYRAAQITLLEDLLARENELTERRYTWHMPVHLIWGERDRLIPNATGLAILRRNDLPETHWHVIPRTGHVANIERPKAFVRELKAVLSMD